MLHVIYTSWQHNRTVLAHTCTLVGPLHCNFILFAQNKLEGTISVRLPGDVIILLGDFNANSASHTVKAWESAVFVDKRTATTATSNLLVLLTVSAQQNPAVAKTERRKQSGSLEELRKSLVHVQSGLKCFCLHMMFHAFCFKPINHREERGIRPCPGWN